VPKYTPMIEQYLEIKKEHQDAILFFRLGDFYEMFFEDAELAAKELEIVLTARDGGLSKVPMCGIPYHSVNNYVAKLISRGYKIAICEQVEDPQVAKGIVKREVIKIITPGTIMDDGILEENSNNYLAAIIQERGIIGFSYIDISTGDFWVTEISGNDASEKLISEMQRLSPAECLVPQWNGFNPLWYEKLKVSSSASITVINKENLNIEKARDLLLEQFPISSLEPLGLKDYFCGTLAAAAIISFLNETQKTSLKHIRKLRTYSTDYFLDMDYSTRRNLELTSTIRENKREGSLLGVLDCCCTAMGKRVLRHWIEQPLRDLEEINKRLDAVEELKNNLIMRSELKSRLSRVYDMERLAGKIGSGLAKPRDLLALKASIKALEGLTQVLQDSTSYILQTMASMDLLGDIYDFIDKSIDDEAQVNIREGGIIKTGYNPEVDELRRLSQQGSNWLIEFEQKEKQRTGIKYLKVGYNKVFGYYIEVSKSNLHMIPENYHRKQTLVNTERFICEELKNYEDRILGARGKLYSLEYNEFNKIREQLGRHLERIQKTAHEIACIDVFFGLSEAAYINDYIRPRVDESGTIKIKAGRHPVVEKSLRNSRFVPNDINININTERFAIITGPNMGGKSTFMRQIALLVIMAQMGSFIPADKAQIGIVDKIFTRVGAADDLARGQSTFMVEMVEVANILNNSTDSSLIILDEIGRGTSTYDGLSIAQSVSEYIHKNIKAKTLFATHYHELTSLSQQIEGVINLSVSVKESGDTIVFLKKVLPGKADKSYGLHVARLAGLPERVISRAQEILTGLEEKKIENQKESITQPGLFVDNNPVFEELFEELNNLNPDELSPRDALMYLYRLKELVKNRPS